MALVQCTTLLFIKKTLILSPCSSNFDFVCPNINNPKPYFSIRSLSTSCSDSNGGGEKAKTSKKLSEQSSWEAKDSEGKDYLYRLGKESDNMNIAVGARAGIIDDLFTGKFLGTDCTSSYTILSSIQLIN